LDGLQVIGNASNILTEIAGKIDENESILSNRRKSFLQKLQDLFQQILGREPDPVIYELQYNDPVRNTSVRDRLNYRNFRLEIDKKNRILVSLTHRGNAKLESMPEEQLMQILDRNIRDVQSMHKTLTALDDFFKASATKEERDKIKGIKPELASLKNSIVRSNQLRHEYSAQKEEEEQMKRLGVSPGV
jgi:DNA-binding transcriptional regulator/RsmH inhibitor MraZ